MVTENLESKKKRALEIIKRLKKRFPDAKIELNFKNPIDLLTAVILSAQCTDKRVNLVTPAVFKKYKTAKNYAQANQKTLEALVRSTGFYSAKTRNIIGAFKEITKRFSGKVPDKMEDLITLPGVGRKTANVILGNIYGIPGLVVDTHMIRISNRLKLTNQKDPVKIETELTQIVPQKEWTLFSHLIIWHGRRICFARKPNCIECTVNNFCPSREDLKKFSVGLKKETVSK